MNLSVSLTHAHTLSVEAIDNATLAAKSKTYKSISVLTYKSISAHSLKSYERNHAMSVMNIEH